MMQKIGLCLALLCFGFSTLFSKNTISRIEPNNWWVGMHEPKVQLLVYGKDIADLYPKVTYAGVRIEQVTRVENANYLFIDLVIDKSALPGTLRLDFFKNKKQVESHDWQLLKRTMSGAAHKGFTNSDVLYLITPDRFANGDATNDAVAGMTEQPNRAFHGGRHGGDIEGMRQHLDYIKDMGFTAIWLNPVLENNMETYSYHGYSTTDFYKVDPRYGTNASYKQLADEARSKGIGLIMDMIVNHCGLEHWWMKDLPMADWINTWPTYTETNHRKSLIQDPYASQADHKIFTDGWFVPSMPDINQRNAFMATYLIQNSIWWVEYLGLTGIRMDTYPYPDMEFMTVWTEKVMAEYPNFNIVGEEWYEEASIVSYWQRGKKNANGYTSGLPSLMDFPLQAALSKGLNADESWGEGLIGLYVALSQDFLYADPNALVVFPDNHDMNRIYTQLKEDYGLFKMAMAYTLTTRGVPQLYYGTEILMANPNSGEHGIIRSDFPGGWKGDTTNAFTGLGLTKDQLAAQSYLKKILNWRKTATAVHNGKFLHFIPKDGVYVYFRTNEQQRIMVVLNKNKEVKSLDLSRFAEALIGVKSAKNALTGDTIRLGSVLDLPVRDALILELK